MRKCRREKTISTKTKIAFLMVFLILLSILSFGQYKRQICPNIDAVCQLKAKGLITGLINEALKENFSGTNYEKKLFLVKTGENGKIQMVQSNTETINKLASSFAADLQKKYDSCGSKDIYLSYGTLLGSKLLSQTAWKVKVKVVPLSVAKCDFETEFESKGINQTKYRVFLKIKSSVRVLQPFSASNFTTQNKVLIAETIIVGDVPNSYVMVPKDDILDVTDE